MNDRNEDLTRDGRSHGLASDLTRYWNVVLRRWWLVVGAVLLCVGAAWWSQRGAMPTYTAEALLQQQTDEPVVGAALGMSNRADFGSQVEILRSRAVLATVVDSLGLQLEPTTQQNLHTEIFQSVSVASEGTGGSYLLEQVDDGRFRVIDAATGARIADARPGDLVEGPDFEFVLGSPGELDEPVSFTVRNHEVALERLRSRIRVEQGQGRDLLRVIFRSTDPRLAASVVNTVASSYQQYRAQAARQAAARRKEVIAREIQSMADSLRRTQEQVESYQAGAQLLDPTVEGNALMSALLEAENELRQFRYERGLLESLVAGLQGGDADDESLRRIMALGRELVPAGQALDQRLQELQAERRRLTASRFGATDQAPEVEVIDAQIASTREQMRITAEQALDLLESRVRAAEDRISDLRGQMGQLPSRAAELTRLQQRADAVQGVFDRLVERYYEAQIAEGVEAGDVAVVDAAAVPLRPDPSGLTFNLAIALLGGLVVGTLGALALDQFDSRVRWTRDTQSAAGLRVVGAVPRIHSGRGSSKALTVGMEAFRGIRTNLRFAVPEQPRLLAVSSAAPGEGKTTVSINLALSMAEEGKQVLVVDADLRRGCLHEVLGVPRSPGLVEAMAGQAALADVCHRSSVHPSLDVVPRGAHQDQRSQFLAGEEFSNVLGELRARYDIVLVDTPPILAVADASVVANAVEGTLVVVRANRTDEEALENAVEQLRRVNAPLVGVILNDVDLRAVGYSEYYESYHLEEDGDRKGVRRKEHGKRFLVGSTGGATPRGETE